MVGCRNEGCRFFLESTLRALGAEHKAQGGSLSLEERSQSAVLSFLQGEEAHLLLYLQKETPAAPQAAGGGAAEPADLPACPPQECAPVQPSGAEPIAASQAAYNVEEGEQQQQQQQQQQQEEVAGGPAEGGSAAQPAAERSQAPVSPTAAAAVLRLCACTPARLPAAAAGCPMVHFARSGTQPLQVQELESGGVMCTLLPQGPPLAGLRQLLQHVLAPWLAEQLGSSSSSSQQPGPGSLGELLAATTLFATQLEHAAQQLGGGEVQLAVPPGVDLRDPGAVRGEEAVLACERTVEEWVRTIAATQQREAARQAADSGPLAELELWRARAAAYGHLHEQLGLPAVRAVAAVVEGGSGDASLRASFRQASADPAQLALEARDNVRFLSTLERHFRDVVEGSLEAVAEALPPMLNALRMIWVISRYYGDDMHMGGLLERISRGLQARLDVALDLRALFGAPPAQAAHQVRCCQAVGRGWLAGYLAQRERLESSGHHARWEFNRQLLFDRTSYAAEVCGELLGMLEAVGDLRQFLGPELRSVTGDEGVIEEVAVMVQAMVDPVEGVAFNVFDKAHAADWQAICARFARDADDVRLATRDLIDACFARLRSMEAAAQLLHTFRRINAQGAIQRQMGDKLVEVLEHFIREVEGVRRLFEGGRERPPLARSMPPVAGSIRWSRALFARVGRTLAKLQALPEVQLESLDAGKRAISKCTELARVLMEYEKARFKAWAAGVDATVNAALQQPVLQRRHASPHTTSDPAGGGASDAVGGADPSNGALAVNLPPPLLQLAREARYLDSLGFALPELALNAALQEGRFRQHAEELGGLLQHHARALAAVRPPEQPLLREHVAALEQALEPGMGRLTWASLAVPDFVAGAHKTIDEFEALLAQVHKHAGMLERAVQHIGRAQLLHLDAISGAAAASARPSQDGQPVGSTLPPTDGSSSGGGGGASSLSATSASASGVPSLQQFYEEVEAQRAGALAVLVGRYRALPPLLVKVEEAVVGSSSGASPLLAGYYAYWERRAFGAVLSMVLRAMAALHDRLRGCGLGSSDGSDGGGGGPPMPPAFKVVLSLLPPETALSPSSAELSKQLGRLLRNVVESSKVFVRWMDGTCRECPEQHVYGDDAEPFVFSFYADVSQTPAIVRAMLGANHTVQRCTTALQRHLEGWRAYASLWRGDRAAQLARLAARRPSHAFFEEKLSKYAQLAEEVWLLGQQEQGAEFVRVDCTPLAAAVREEARAWVRGLAGVMAATDAPLLASTREHCAALLEALVEAGGEESTLRAREAVVAAQSAAAVALEAAADLEERCRTRLAYATPGDDLEAAQAELREFGAGTAAWRELQAAATTRAQQLDQEAAAAAAAALVAEASAGQGSVAASEASATSRTSSNRRGSVVPPAAARRGSVLARTLSTSSNASSQDRAQGRRPSVAVNGGRKGPE